MAYAFFMNASTPGDVAVYAVTAKGLALGRALARELPATLFASARLADGGPPPLAASGMGAIRLSQGWHPPAAPCADARIEKGSIAKAIAIVGQ